MKMMPDINNKAFVRFEHVDFSYYGVQGEIHVINDMSFSIEKGSFTAIIGRNGSGKSTLAKKY